MRKRNLKQSLVSICFIFSLFVSMVSAAICACSETHEMMQSNSCHDDSTRQSHSKSQHNETSPKTEVSKTHCVFCKRSVEDQIGVKTKASKDSKEKQNTYALVSTDFEFGNIVKTDLGQIYFRNEPVYANPISFFKPSRSPPVL